MAINIDDIKKVKEVTGASLTDCKDALQASNGDVTIAISSFLGNNKITIEKIQYVCHKTGADFKESKQVLLETNGNAFIAIDRIETKQKHNSSTTFHTRTKYDSSSSENLKTGSRKLNIVVVGRSGVGKSSFLNYAAGKKVFETGIGEPVTQQYFQEVDVEETIKNIKYCLFDTKGLEAGNTSEWKNAVYSEIDKRDASDNIYDWFHTIIFCIDASAKRIQPFEVQAIKDLSKKGSVLVLLTKKDLVEPSILEALKQQIASDIGTHVQVLSVCSVSMRTRKGESHASGLEDVLRVSFFGLWEKAAKVLPNQAITPLMNINTNIRIGNKLSDTLAFFSLKIPYCPDKERNLTIYPNKLVLATLYEGSSKFEISNELSGLYDDKSISPRFGIFSHISLKSDIPYKFATEDIIITVKGDAREYLNIPNVLSHSELDYKYYRESIITFLRLINDIVIKLKDNLLYNNTTKRKIVDHNSTVQDILKFYKDITGYNLRHIDNTKTKEASKLLEDFTFYRNFWDKFLYKKSELIRTLNIIDSCFMFSNAERRETEQEYHSFKEFLEDFLNEINERIDNLRKYYSSELHAYGEYCIREDELVIKDNNKQVDIKLLKDLIISSLSDGIMTPKEYKMIRAVAESQGVTDMSLLDDIIKEVKKEKRK